MLLSSGFMSTERPVIVWSSRLWNWWSTFLNMQCFYNKPHIWVLNNYILAWNTRVQCRQALAVVARCGTSGVAGVTRLSIRNKATSASDRRPSAPWVLSRAGELIRSDMYTFLSHRSTDVFLLCFFILVYLSLFWYSAPTQFYKMFLKNWLSYI